jgi:hypothetical protein
MLFFVAYAPTVAQADALPGTVQATRLTVRTELNTFPIRYAPGKSETTYLGGFEVIYIHKR